MKIEQTYKLFPNYMTLVTLMQTT